MIVQAVEVAQLNWVLSQKSLPVAIRLGVGHKLIVRVPFAEGNRKWLQDGRRTSPVWYRDKQEWEIPQAWFNDFVNRSLEKYGKVYVVQPYREQEVCAPNCWKAEGHICQCSCMGANHGSGSSGGRFVVSDTFAVRWGSQHLACRLMTKN